MKTITILGVVVGIIVGGISILQAVQGQPNPFAEMAQAVIGLVEKLGELADRCLQDCTFN